MDLSNSSEWIENDLNPFITFTSNGKIHYLNAEAQFLLNRVKTKEIFDLAVKYASNTYGFNTTYVHLNLGHYTFYAISVNYADDDFICIKLYKSIMAKKEAKFKTDSESVNLFTILDLAISSNSIKYKNINKKIKFVKNYDPSIPDLKISVNQFLKVLNSVYSKFDPKASVTTDVRLKTGEFIRLNGKKYSLIQINIFDDNTTIMDDLDLIDQGNECGLFISCVDNMICINMPLIT